jgi:hypothetical protein
MLLWLLLLMLILLLLPRRSRGQRGVEKT